MPSSDSTKVDGEFAGTGTFVVVVSDDENAPRILPGRHVIVQPRETYSEGWLVLVEHPTRREEGSDGKMYPVCYIRVYEYESMKWVLRPINPKAETFEFNETWKIIGLVRGQRRLMGPGWFITELAEDSLPVSSSFSL
jgi:SOS-response transcriptional repressor LexA